MAEKQIKGTHENLMLLRKELRNEGIKVSTAFSERYTHANLYKSLKQVSFYIHGIETGGKIKLNANLPSHRKHFVNKAKEVLNGSS